MIFGTFESSAGKYSASSYSTVEIMTTKKYIEQVLAITVLTFIILGTTFLTASNLFGQMRGVLRFGTTMSEAETIMERQAGLRSAEANVLHFENERLHASYGFQEGQLRELQVVKRYKSRRQANEDLQSYLVYLERIHGEVFPVHEAKGVVRYAAITDNGVYELAIVSGARNQHTFMIQASSGEEKVSECIMAMKE